MTGMKLLGCSALLVFLGCIGGSNIAAQERLYAFADGVRNGTAVANAGDIDRDGYPDILVGAGGTTGPGTAYVYSGKDGRTLFSFRGKNNWAQYGISVDGAGDVNRDGYPDFLISEPAFTSTPFIEVRSGKDGKVLWSINVKGNPVSGIGDVDRDGHADFAAAGGAEVRLFSGKTGKLIQTLTGSSGYGSGLARAGDLNLDGYPDFVVASPGHTEVRSGKDRSRLWVVSFGGAAASGRDLNKDGYPDVMIGRPRFNNGRGVVQVLSGKDQSRLLLSVAHPSPTTVMNFGWTVHFIDDHDGDAVPDIVTTGVRNTTPLPSNGIWVLSGRDGKLIRSFVGSPTFPAEPHAIAGVGDINKDGAGDFAVGDPRAGRTWIVSGKRLEMWSDTHLVKIRPAGVQRLAMDFGTKHAGQNYWIFGSATGMHPGTRLGSFTVPVVVDAYTPILIGLTNSSVFQGFRGQLDATGKASASIRVPTAMPSIKDSSFFHAGIVYDRNANLRAVSNAVPIRVVN